MSGVHHFNEAPSLALPNKPCLTRLHFLGNILVIGFSLNVCRYPYSWGQLSPLTLPQWRTGRSCGLMSYEENIMRNNGTSLRTLWRSKMMVRVLQPVSPGKWGFAGKPRVISTSPYILEEKGKLYFHVYGSLEKEGESHTWEGTEKDSTLGYHGLRDCGANCIFSCLGITVVSCVLCIGELGTGRVGLGGFQTQLEVSWTHINITALGTTHPGKPKPLFTYSLCSVSYLTGGDKPGKLSKHWSLVPCLYTLPHLRHQHPQVTWRLQHMHASIWFACALTSLL